MAVAAFVTLVGLLVILMGMTFQLIKSLEERLTHRLDRMEDQLSARMDRLDARMGRLEDKLDLHLREDHGIRST